MKRELNGAKHTGQFVLQYENLNPSQRVSMIVDFFRWFNGMNSIDYNGINRLTCTFCLEGQMPWYMETYLNKWLENLTYISFTPYGNEENPFMVEPGYLVIGREVKGAEISELLYYFFNHFGKKNAIKITDGKLLLKMKLYMGFRAEDEVLKISDCDTIFYEGVSEEGKSLKTIETFERISEDYAEHGNPTEPDENEESKDSAEPDGDQEPENSAEPDENVEPEDPTEHDENLEPENPAEPDGAGEPENSVEPDENEEPENSTDPDENEDFEDPAEPDENEEPEVSTEPDENLEPEDSTEPDENLEPENSAEPDGAEEPGNFAEPDENAELKKPAEPEGNADLKSDKESVLETNLQALAEKSRSYEEFVRYVCKWIGYKKEESFVGISRLERSELDWPTMMRKVESCNTTDRNFLPTAIINKCKQIGMGRVRFKTFMLTMFKFKTFDFAGTQRAISTFGNNKRINWIQELVDILDSSLRFESKVRKIMWNIGKETEAFSGDIRETIIKMVIDAITPEEINYNLFVCNPSLADIRNRAITLLDSMINEYNESKGSTERIEINEFLLNVKLAIENMR
ncbi:MAG: hypothetical protein J6J36_03440 [Clostridia bacterium]|nr:hypothetical protein [Clostridia bacterium]